MSWPSVHFWGWVLAWANFPIFFGMLFLSGWLADLIAEVLGRPVDLLWVLPVVLIGVVIAEFKVLACPRCGRYVYMRNSMFMKSMWPVRRCSKCSLDLKRFHPFDKRARAAD